MTALLTAEFRKVLGLRYWWILGITPVVWACSPVR